MAAAASEVKRSGEPESEMGLLGEREGFHGGGNARAERRWADEGLRHLSRKSESEWWCRGGGDCFEEGVFKEEQEERLCLTRGISEVRWRYSVDPPN